MKISHLFIAFIAACTLCTCTTQHHPPSKIPPPSRDATYTLTRTRNDSAGTKTSIPVKFTASGNEMWYIEGLDSFTITFDPQGNFQYVNDTGFHARYDLLTFNIGPPPGTPLVVGSTWQKKWPLDQDGTKDPLAISAQEIFTYKIMTVNGDTITIDINGSSRYFDTKALADVTGAVLGFNPVEYQMLLNKIFPYAKASVVYDARNQVTLGANGRYAGFSYLFTVDRLEDQKQLTSFMLTKN